MISVEVTEAEEEDTLVAGMLTPDDASNRPSWQIQWDLADKLTVGAVTGALEAATTAGLPVKEDSAEEDSVEALAEEEATVRATLVPASNPRSLLVRLSLSPPFFV